MTTAEKLTQIAENQQAVYDAGFAEGQAQGGGGSYDQGYTDGQQAEYDRFWDAVFTSLNGNFNNAFIGRGWTDETYNPNRSIICTKNNATTAFNNAMITTTKVPIEIRVATADMVFAGCSNLKTVVSLGFWGVTSTSSFFAGCNNLENLTAEGEWQSSIGITSPKLTNESVQSVIDHLADLTGKTAQKLALHATVGAKLTQAQKYAVSAKNWTLAY